MKRSALIVPGIAAVLAAAIVAFVGPFNSPSTRAAASLQFEATFGTASDFYGRFDYGFSGLDPASGSNGVPALPSFHGDHNAACEGPTTDRTVHYTADYSELFWHCAPGNDPAKGHIMTGVDTLGYNIAWFSPKPSFERVTQVCWDVNQTAMSSRKWIQVMFVDARPGADATRYPAGGPTDGSGVARGVGGFDLGFTSPDFRNGVAPSTGIEPHSGTLAGLKATGGGMFRWFENQDNWTGEVGWMPSPGTATSDKAARFKNCVVNQPNNTIRITQMWTQGQRTFDIPGQLPQHPVRVVFQDDNYDPAKDANYNANVLTWHWDNIQVFTDSDAPPTTTTPPTTTPPTTTPPTTTPPTTTPPTTTPPTTTPPTTTPPTTTPPTTTPPTTTPDTTTPPTTTPPTTAPPTTTPPTTAPPTTTPPTTAPPTTTPPTTAPPTTTPPTTAPPTTTPPTTAPPTTTPDTTAPPTTNVPGAPIVNITSGPAETTTSPDAEIAFEVVDPSPDGKLLAVDPDAITCSLDGQPAEPCSSPVLYRGLEIGEHEVVVMATDGSGGLGTAVYNWAVVAGINETADQGSPASGSQAPATGARGVQRAVLSFTGSYITEIAIFGLVLIAVGLALGSAATISRRRSG